jgi:hypothetical protein
MTSVKCFISQSLTIFIYQKGHIFFLPNLCIYFLKMKIFLSCAQMCRHTGNRDVKQEGDPCSWNCKFIQNFYHQNCRLQQPQWLSLHNQMGAYLGRQMQRVEASNCSIYMRGDSPEAEKQTERRHHKLFPQAEKDREALRRGCLSSSPLALCRRKG